MIKCESCSHLAIWPKLIGGSRYLCDVISPSPKPFGRFGFSIDKGYPKVQKCVKYEEGRHYSRKESAK
jgi:hypothetical protein